MRTVIKMSIVHVILTFLMMGAYSASLTKRSADNNEGLPTFAEHLPKKLTALNSFTNNAAQNGHISTLIKNINERSEVNTDDAKLGIPGPLPIDIEQIKKIATIIGFIGNQLLPALIDPNGGAASQDYVENVK